MFAYHRHGLRSHFDGKTIAEKKQLARFYRGAVPAWPQEHASRRGEEKGLLRLGTEENHRAA